MITEKEVIINQNLIEEEVLTDNAMLKHRPDLLNEWDFEKNDKLELDIYSLSYGSNTKVWWLCKKGHSYEMSIKLKIQGRYCMYCNSRKLLVGFNDLNTTNPRLSALLWNPEDGNKYMQFSKFSVNWKCPICDRKIENKKISDVNIYGLSCPDCSDGIKYPEKVMREVLKQLKVKNFRDQSFEWSNNRRYDFFLPDHNIIIETHGGQHYNGGFKTYKTGATLEQEIENDAEKLQLAKENNVAFYIVIDCRESKIDLIRKNVLESDLSLIFDLSLIDWFQVEKSAQKSISYECLKLWNNGMRDIESIASTLDIHREMVRRYLKQWSKLEKCDFGSFSKNKRSIVQLNDLLEPIKIWSSLSEAELEFSGKKSSRAINRSLSNHVDKAYGFNWMYESDFETYKATGEIVEPSVKRRIDGAARSVVQFDLSGNYIKTYPSIAIAAKGINIKTHNHITSCCRGKRNSCGGFKWMYKEDYDKLNSNI